MESKPSIGRIVHFHAGEPFETYAAIITGLGATDELVHMVTFGPHSMYHHQNVRFSERPAAGCWTWPPRV